MTSDKPEPGGPPQAVAKTFTPVVRQTMTIRVLPLPSFLPAVPQSITLPITAAMTAPVAAPSAPPVPAAEPPSVPLAEPPSVPLAEPPSVPLAEPPSLPSAEPEPAATLAFVPFKPPVAELRVVETAPSAEPPVPEFSWQPGPFPVDPPASAPPVETAAASPIADMATTAPVAESQTVAPAIEPKTSVPIAEAAAMQIASEPAIISPAAATNRPTGEPPVATSTGSPPVLAFPANLLRGPDGTLFGLENAAIAQLCDASTLNDQDGRRLATAFETRFAWCALRDIRYYTLVVPDKIAVYADKWPHKQQPSPQRPALRLRQLLAPRFLPYFLYPLERLRDGRAMHETYFRTDSHWSRYGAYLGYRELAEALALHLPVQPIDEAALHWVTQRFTGDLGGQLHPPLVEEFSGVLTRQILPIRATVLNRAAEVGQVELFENVDRSLPTLVMFRSDYSINLIDPFLAAHFSRIVALTGPAWFFPDLVLAEMPDVVITEIPERQLALPADGGGAQLPPEMLANDVTAMTGLTLPLPLGGRRG